MDPLIKSQLLSIMKENRTHLEKNWRNEESVLAGFD
jgi:hypothetical protein